MDLAGAGSTAGRGNARSEKVLAVARWLLVAGTIGWVGPVPVSAESIVVIDGAKVTLTYTVRLQDRTVVDSNVGKEPLTFVQGAHEIVPGLEKALQGMKPGDKASIPVSAADAYGPYSHKKRKTVDRAEVPADARSGSIVRSPGGDFARVVEMDDRSVLLDFNHPLAGKNLIFEVHVLKVEPGEHSTGAPAAPSP